MKTTSRKSTTVPRCSSFKKLSLEVVDRPTGSGRVRQPVSIFPTKGTPHWPVATGMHQTMPRYPLVCSLPAVAVCNVKTSRTTVWSFSCPRAANLNKRHLQRVETEADNLNDHLCQSQFGRHGCHWFWMAGRCCGAIEPGYTTLRTLQ
jgi:hypothetical protein